MIVDEVLHRGCHGEPTGKIKFLHSRVYKKHPGYFDKLHYITRSIERDR
jgi:hypothetical protein